MLAAKQGLHWLSCGSKHEKQQLEKALLAEVTDELRTKVTDQWRSMVCQYELCLARRKYIDDAPLYLFIRDKSNSSTSHITKRNIHNVFREVEHLLLLLNKAERVERLFCCPVRVRLQFFIDYRIHLEDCQDMLAIQPFHWDDWKKEQRELQLRERELQLREASKERRRSATTEDRQ